MLEAIGIGLAAGAVIGGLLGAHIPDVFKGWGTLGTALVAASLMGATVLAEWRSTHPAADFVNAALALLSVMVASRYGAAFWISGVIGSGVAYSVADSIRSSSAS